MKQTTAYHLRTPANFSVYLRSLRQSRGMTQRDLGHRIGVSGARISEIEKDPGGVGLTQILKLLHVLGAEAVIEIRNDQSAHEPRRDPSTPAGEW